VKGLGTLTKDPKNPQPLTDEQLQAIFDVASKNGISKEQAIKKHLVKLRAKVEEEVVPVAEPLEKFEVDNEE